MIGTLVAETGFREWVWDSVLEKYRLDLDGGFAVASPSAGGWRVRLVVEWNAEARGDDVRAAWQRLVEGLPRGWQSWLSSQGSDRWYKGSEAEQRQREAISHE